MNKFLLRFLLAAAVTVLAVSLTQSGEAQTSGQDAFGPVAPVQSSPAAQQQNNEAQMPSSGDTTTHEANAFTGRVVRQNGEIVLMDPVTKVTYKFDDPAKAKKYVGQHVKVTGKLDMNSNTILVESIEIIS